VPTAPAVPAPACADCGAAGDAGEVAGSVGAGEVVDGGVVAGAVVLGEVVLGAVVLGALVLGEAVELGDVVPLVPVAPEVPDDAPLPIVGFESTKDGDAAVAPAADADCSPDCTQPVTVTICALPDFSLLVDAAPDCGSCAAAPTPNAAAKTPAKTI
jgi:hypothetical protein